MRSIFISYRRGDAEGQAGRLFDDLATHFGKNAVFMDVEDIEPGRDFRKVIDQHVSSCGVLLALVGKRWLDATDEEGHRRLDDPNDFVRLETASALKRDIPVIPVLVQGAGMPKADSLPDDLKEFAFRNAVELTHARWVSDVQLLIKALGRYVDTGKEQEEAAKTDSDKTPKAVDTAAVSPVKESETQPAKPAPSPPDGQMRWIPIMIAAIVVIALAAGGYIMYDKAQKTSAAIAQKEAEDKIKKEIADKNNEITRINNERNQLQMDADKAKKMTQQAEEKRLRAEKARKAAEDKAAAAQLGNTDTGATTTGGGPKKKAKKAQRIALITNVRFDPPTNSTLYNGQQVNVFYSYMTTEANGVRIFTYPLSNGKSLRSYGYSPSSLYKTGSGTGRDHFTNRSGSGNTTVDSVKITMMDSNRNVVFERVYPASFEFKDR